jgi:RND superfamily putative drug exporter
VFRAIGRQTYRWRAPVIGIWTLLFLAAIPFLLKVEEPLKVGGFSSDRTEAARARAVLERELAFSPSTMVVIFESERLTATDRAFLAQTRLALADIPSVSHVVDIVLPEEDPSLISRDGTIAYALVGMDLPPEEAQRFVPEFRAALRETPDLTVLVAGGPAFYADIETVSQRDLRRAELIAFPFALAALLLVFGSVVAALVPLAVGGLGVAAVLLALYWTAHATDLSIFVLNLATMLGLGLAVDYSLFVTSRFREEMARGDGDVARAIEVTIGTAGRAIFFSGLTVLIGLSGLALFDFMFLRSVGIAGVIVVFFSVLAALTLLPAVLGVIGTRIERGRLIGRAIASDHREHGFWAGLSHRVMARPIAVLIPTLAVLVLLGLPFIHVDVSSPDATILPTDLPSRQGFDILTDEFGPGEISPFVFVLQSPSGVYSRDNLLALYDFTEMLAEDPRVVRVQSIVSFDVEVPREQVPAVVALRRGAQSLGIDSRLDQFANERTVMVLAFTRSYANSDENKELLAETRAYQPGGDLTMLVDGGTAEIVDVVDAMYGQFPKAIALIVVATYLVLLVLFRAVLLPLKAIAMNTLSILASYGALVWIFQDGHFNSVLRFEPLGFVEASLPIIMFCVLFGLSMDYEVFLLSRVREEWERSGDNTHSVAVGLQRSGRIITSAALIVVVVTASFVSADVILIKALGLGIALAVFLDATIVRALLVPATMRLLGSWNWWMPAWLARLLPAHSLVDESGAQERLG